MSFNSLRSLAVEFSLLAEVSHDVNDGRETSAGFRRVVWWSRRPNFWSKLTGCQNRFRLMCYARALSDWTLTIIDPAVDYGFREFRNLSIRAIKSSVSTLGDKRIKEITSLERKAILAFLKGRDKFACLLTGYGKSLISHLSSTSGRRVICCLQLQGSLLYRTSGWWVSLRVTGKNSNERILNPRLMYWSQLANRWSS